MPKLRIFTVLVFGVFLYCSFELYAQESAFNLVNNQVNAEINAQPEEAVSVNEEAMDSQAQEAPLSEPADVLWVWGEVVALDPAQGNIKVKYLDYETDNEVEAIFNFDKESVFENVSSIADIKVTDSVGIDYYNRDAKYIVKSISVEKLNSPDAKN